MIEASHPEQIELCRTARSRTCRRRGQRGRLSLYRPSSAIVVRHAALRPTGSVRSAPWSPSPASFRSIGRRSRTSRRSSASWPWCSGCSPSSCTGRSARDEASRMVAEQVAVAIAGKMMARSQEDGDRFSLKESNSIKALIAEAVLALDARTHGRRGGPSTSSNRRTARSPPRSSPRWREPSVPRPSGRHGQAASALRHQGALTLPKDRTGALRCSNRRSTLDPGQCGKSARSGCRPVQAGRYSERRGLDREGARRRGPKGTRGYRRLVDMFAGVLHLRRGRFPEAIEKFEAPAASSRRMETPSR